MAHTPDSTRERIRAESYELLAQRGVAGLSMRALADRLHLKAASLYKHVRDKDEIVADLQARGTHELAVAITAAGPWPMAAAQAYRAWARANPHLYEVTMRRPLLRDRMPPGLEADVTAMVIALTGGDHEHARAVWALVHGLVDLELAGRFPDDPDLDTTWRRAIALVR